ncbi:MAG: hypothetical protein RSF67_07765 [Clostridia bacterium]
MSKLYNYEKDLVDTFIKIYFENKNKVSIKELPIRWGNIDIAFITGNKKNPFNEEQIKALSKPSNAKIFMRIKKNRPIFKKTLFKELGISESTFNNCLHSLISLSLISKDENDKYIRNIDYEFPKVKIYGYEAKLIDYNKAYYQACINKDYVDYSYMVFPIDIATKIKKKHFLLLKENNIGLIGVNDKNYKILIKATKNNNIKPYIKLITLMQCKEA